ncbi:MAG TPA: phosphohydrolase [Candidatus Cloacimonadota bacterium]|nr:phosphohydrolase [Candidatus Cloacimonadota bacterium]
MKKSVIQQKFEEKIRRRLCDKPLAVFEYLIANQELQAMHDYANIVSIKRLGFNDHGPVHMRKAALNALLMFDLLMKAGIKLNLEREGVATAEDSKIAVVTAAMLHDLGMTVSRDKHEFMSVHLGLPFINELLEKFYPNDIMKKAVLRSLIVECIFGHMATQTIHTLEAGLVLIGDGCDMEQGRARITTMLSDKPRVGDIHKYSSTGIAKVHIVEGEERPIKIKVDMTESVGFFQIEEVLFPKIASSPVKEYIELEAGVLGKEYKKYI